jgi:ABC-type glycerol-3-phosphate transport system substrate-binding protein
MPEILKNKKVLIIIGVIVILLASLVFWLLQPKQQQAILADNSPVTLTWWKVFYGDDVYAQAIQDFKKLPGNQNVTINIVTKDYSNPSDYYQSLISDIAANAGPDIFSLRNDDLPAYQKYMTPINNFQGATLADYKNNFVPLAVRDTMVKDKVYAITSYVDNLELYYNTDILAQAGIPLPPATWQDLDKQLPLLNKRTLSGVDFNQSAIAFGTGFDSTDSGGNINRFQDIIPALIFQNGAQLYDYQSDTGIFGQANPGNGNTATSTSTTTSTTALDNSNPTYNALRFYYDFADSTTNRYSWNSNQSNDIDAFASGKLAYLVHYSYLQDTLAQKNPRLNYKIAEIPQVNPSNKKTYGFFFMDGLNRKLQTDVDNAPTDTAKARKLKVASDFMQFLSQEQEQADFVSKTNLPGAQNQVIADQLTRADNIRVFAAGSLYSDNYYKPDVDKSEDMWGQLLYRTIYQNQPLSDSLQQAITQYNLILNSPPKLRG